MDKNLIFQPHSLVFREGDKAENIFIVKYGEVLCLRSSTDRLIPVYKARKGDIIGESAIISDSPHTYSAISLNDVELIQIPAENFKPIMDLAPNWISDLAVTMLNRFQSTADVIAKNRVIHDAIISEEDFPSSLEVEFSKLINQ